MKGLSNMQKILIRQIDEENASDISLKNEPFELFGKMLPSYRDGEWSYAIQKNEKRSSDLFPQETYDFESMKKEYLFIGAYDGSKCVGLAVLKHEWNQYMYLHDLKVSGAYRGRHIATEMLDAACGYAKEHGYRGVWTIGQDNNLAACLLYVNTGFRIGGLDTEVYVGTRQEGKADIYFYRDA